MTLAQQYIGHGTMRYSDPEVQWTHDFILRRLLLPLPGAEGLTAERFVFDENAPMRLNQWCEAGMVEWNTAVKTIREPDFPMWVEYPMLWGERHNAPGRIGFMYGSVKDSIVEKPQRCVAFVGSDPINNKLGPQGLLMLPEFPLNPGNNPGGRLVWFQDETDPRRLDQSQIEMARDFFGDFLACLFLLQTPKVTERAISNFGPRKASVRKRTGKPFVELHRVTIRVGMAEPRYDNTSGVASATGTGARRKYHRVMPFFRTYHKDTNAPKVQLIDSFWRGDISKGIIIHERRAKLGKGPFGPREDSGT